MDKKRGGALKKDKYGHVPKQRKFIREYIRDYNGTQAALRAGYSKGNANPQAARLLAKASIQEAIERAERDVQNKFYQTKERILRELAIIGFADQADYIEQVGDQDRIKSIGDMPLYASRAIKTIKTKTRRVLGAVDFVIEEKEITLHDKLTALVKMGQEIGMFKETRVITGENGGPIKVEAMTDEELLGIIKAGSRPGAA